MHKHDFDNDLYTCKCGRTREEEYDNLATHPGKPTSEKIWELRHKLFLMVRHNL